MNVELIKIPQDIAKAKLASYRKAIAAREHSKAAEKVTAEYQQIEAGYKAAAKGLPLIELSKAMAMGGWDEQGRPKFAVARADTREVHWHCGHNSEICFSRPGGPGCWKRGSFTTRFLLSRMPARPVDRTTLNSARAIVPMVPPDVLPRPDLDLSRRVILWEADWTAAPVDPLLLLPIGGDLYAVEAAWDLTPLERAVIAGRGR